MIEKSAYWLRLAGTLNQERDADLVKSVMGKILESLGYATLADETNWMGYTIIYRWNGRINKLADIIQIRKRTIEISKRYFINYAMDLNFIFGERE